jgi:hypothetical protein
VMNGRRGLGAELKASYFRQALANLADAERGVDNTAQSKLDFKDETERVEEAADV